MNAFLHALLDFCIWAFFVALKIIGGLFVLFVVIAIIFAHHKGKNIWLAPFTKGGFKNWR